MFIFPNWRLEPRLPRACRNQVRIQVIPASLTSCLSFPDFESSWKRLKNTLSVKRWVFNRYQAAYKANLSKQQLQTVAPSTIERNCKCYQFGNKNNVSILNVEIHVLSRFGHVWLFVTPWTVAHQAPLSMEFSRQKYFSGLTFPSPGNLPDPGIELRSPILWVDSLLTEPPGKPSWNTYGRFNEKPYVV